MFECAALLQFGYSLLIEYHFILFASECDKIQPRNGEILCVGSYSETASTCHFECPDGLVPGYKRRTSCKAKAKKNKDDKNVVSHYWTEDVNNFECVSTIR